MFTDEVCPAHSEKENYSMDSAKQIEVLDNSEKDSSSGISSPRVSWLFTKFSLLTDFVHKDTVLEYFCELCDIVEFSCLMYRCKCSFLQSSRSLTSTSPPHSPIRKQPLTGISPADSHVTNKSPKQSAPAQFPKRIIPFHQANELHSKGEVKSPSFKQSLSTPSENPNIETTIKPFTEKLAMFRKVQVENQPVSPDSQKSRYFYLCRIFYLVQGRIDNHILPCFR